MEVKARKKSKAIIKSNYKKYLAELEEVTDDHPNFIKRFNSLQRKCNNLVRKEKGSIQSIKEVSRISKIIFGLSEDMIRLSLPVYDFKIEKELINHFIIGGLKKRKETKYFGECKYYGEVILNLYLDVLIVITSNKIDHIIEHKPAYLINPETGQNLELDIVIEGYNLSFELQGDTHYINRKEIIKDKFKIQKSIEKKKYLIPVNLGQLNSETISILIINTLKSALGLHDVITDTGIQDQPIFKTKKWDIVLFTRVAQRMYLANKWFSPSLEWIDTYANRLIQTQQSRSPISTTTEAPSMVELDRNLSLDYIYKRIKYVKKIL
jgi:hypothetical protein